MVSGDLNSGSSTFMASALYTVPPPLPLPSPLLPLLLEIGSHQTVPCIPKGDFGHLVLLPLQVLGLQVRSVSGWNRPLKDEVNVK